MITRYEDARIAEIWKDERRLAHWQDTELAVVQANEELGQFPRGTHLEIRTALENAPIDIAWWYARDKEIRHDLNAFLDERRQYLPVGLHRYFHENITSYDTEEPAFMKMLKQSCEVVEEMVHDLVPTLKVLALKHRYTIMNGRTHGQEAELQTFGKRCLTWLRTLGESATAFYAAQDGLKYAKISGAIGNYGSINPAVERRALELLGFEPFYGATQILPRELHLPLAGALLQISLSLEKIALDIRLGARSGRPIYHEPFSRKQKGSSAMPHKKNTIFSENIQGMARLARGYFDAIRENVVTWEERSIEQSSVERVAWPDLFHVLTFALKRMNTVLTGLVVYPDHMLQEIVELRGCYASSEAKEFLKREGVSFGIDGETGYRIVQLAAFNVFEPSANMKEIRETVNHSLAEADALLEKYRGEESIPLSIREIIERGDLRRTDELDISKEEVERWNEILRMVFSAAEARERWRRIFTAGYLLKNEATLYQEILQQ
ncbi:MAG: lyase family protein [Candidatus Jorgensenbacteria bacterium]